MMQQCEVPSPEDQKGATKEGRKEGQIIVRGVQVYGKKERGIYSDGWRGEGCSAAYPVTG